MRLIAISIVCISLGACESTAPVVPTGPTVYEQRVAARAAVLAQEEAQLSKEDDELVASFTLCRNVHHKLQKKPRV